MDQQCECEIPLKSKFMNLKNYSEKVNWLLFLLLSVFCISSWVSANSIWSELPFYIIESPEGWRLTSVLTVLAQIAQIFPMTLFLLLRHLMPGQITYRRSIYFKLIVEVIACTLLVFFWDKTALVGGQQISLGLYILSFTMSLLCGLSSMTFLPYIGEHFAKQYIVPLYIGESVSSSIPSLIVFFQGSTNPDESACDRNQELLAPKRQYFVHQKHNLTKSLDNVPEILKTDPNFSVSVFFTIIAALMFISSIAFVYVDIVYARRKTMKQELHTKIDLKRKETKEQKALLKQAVKQKAQTVDAETIDNEATPNPSKHLPEKTALFIISFFISFFMYGILPGIQPYSTLPYGYTPFHLSINLGNLLLPIAVMSSIFSKKDSMKSIIAQFMLGVTFSLYLLYISILSPCPPFVRSNLELGAFLAVFSWILIECVFIRLRCKIAERFERFGGEFFLYLGFATLLGQVMGGTVIYLCVDIYRLFTDKPQCVLDFSYCEA